MDVAERTHCATAAFGEAVLATDSVAAVAVAQAAAWMRATQAAHATLVTSLEVCGSWDGVGGGLWRGK